MRGQPYKKNGLLVSRRSAEAERSNTYRAERHSLPKVHKVWKSKAAA